MTSVSYIAVLLMAALSSHAAPMPSQRRSCLSAENAQSVATQYGELISAYSDAAADAILSSNFIDYSAGVNALINTCPQGEAAKTLPLLAPTFTSRELFKIGQGQQPLINFEQLALWHSCDSVTIRWKSTNTAPGNDVKPIVGLIVMETIQAPPGSTNPFLIDTVCSEFDSGSWLQNLAAAGTCGPSTFVVGVPGPVPPQSSAVVLATPTTAVTIGSPTSWVIETSAIRTEDSWTPTASHFQA